jgi:hypothetical protein
MLRKNEQEGNSISALGENQISTRGPEKSAQDQDRETKNQDRQETNKKNFGHGQRSPNAGVLVGKTAGKTKLDQNTVLRQQA